LTVFIFSYLESANAYHRNSKTSQTIKVQTTLNLNSKKLKKFLQLQQPQTPSSGADTISQKQSPSENLYEFRAVGLSVRRLSGFDTKTPLISAMAQYYSGINFSTHFTTIAPNILDNTFKDGAKLTGSVFLSVRNSEKCYRAVPVVGALAHFDSFRDGVRVFAPKSTFVLSENSVLYQTYDIGPVIGLADPLSDITLNKIKYGSHLTIFTGIQYKFFGGQETVQLPAFRTPVYYGNKFLAAPTGFSYQAPGRYISVQYDIPLATLDTDYDGPESYRALYMGDGNLNLYSRVGNQFLGTIKLSRAYRAIENFVFCGDFTAQTFANNLGYSLPKRGRTLTVSVLYKF